MTKPLPTIHINQKASFIKVTQDIDFYELFKIIEKQFSTCFIFESLNQSNDELDRYSLIGFSPDHIIKAKGNTVIVDEKQYEVDNPYRSLKDFMPKTTLSRNFSGGLVGYLGYDCVNYFEKSLTVKTHPDFEQFKFGAYTDGLLYDKTTGEVHYFYHDHNRVKIIEELLLDQTKRDLTFSASYSHDSSTPEAHADTVRTTKEAIRLGKIFQCEVGFKSYFELSGEALGIYDKLRSVNPSPFMYYVKFDDQKIIGASPELLFSLKKDVMTTRPLAGSIRRGKTTIDDVQMARKLLSDPKEIAEHNMLVDLHRNDIGKVARPGSVTITNLLNIKKFSHIQHIESEITGLIQPGENMFSAIAANFPAGTLSGAPKIEAMKIIDENEAEPRGPYGGGVGYFGFNGDTLFAIAIRSLFVKGTHAYAQTSGGNVYDSNPEYEYDEIQRKLAAMKEVLAV